MSWEWPKSERASLARFVLPGVSESIDLKLNRNDLPQDALGRRTLVNAIYFALQQKELRYSLEKYHPEDVIQLIRTPSEIFQTKEGTCLDLALLFCGMCLGYELLPQLVLIEGHAFATVALQADIRSAGPLNRSEKKFFENALLTNVEALKQLVAGGSFLAVECTGFAAAGKLPPNNPEGVGRDFQNLLSFDRALSAGSEQLDNANRPFLFALDIAWANELGIRPEKETSATHAGSGGLNISVAEAIELTDAEVGEIVGGKGEPPKNGEVEVGKGAKITRTKIDSITGWDGTKKD